MLLLASDAIEYPEALAADAIEVALRLAPERYESSVVADP